MILKFDHALTSLEVYAQGAELAMIMGQDRDAQGRRVYSHPDDHILRVAQFQDPVLITDNHKIGALGALDPVQRDTVLALYGMKSRTTSYDGTSLRFVQSNHPGVWGPSIDTLLVCRAFAGLDMSGAKRVVEIGAGSGFISKFLLERHPEIERATLVDVSPLAIKACQEAVTDPRARFYTGDGEEFLENASVDLVVCNPPYIPRPSSIDDNPYEGIRLLVDLIHNTPSYLRPGGRLILNISSLCRQIAMDAVAHADVRAHTIDQLEVPLKVFNVLNNQAWLQHLIEHHGLTLSRRDGYHHWHTIEVLCIEPSLA